GIGPAAYAEYEAVFGRRKLGFWPGHTVVDGLDLVESFVCTNGFDGQPNLLIHPDYSHLIGAFENYVRAKRGNVWMGYPEDPLHPAEDLMDALRGGLYDRYPDGKRVDLVLPKASIRRVF